MTKKKGKWYTKEEEYITILYELAVRGELYTTDFKSNVLINEPIPHASLRKRLRELEYCGEITSVYSTRTSKKGLLIKKFRIRVWGLMRLLIRLSESKNNLDSKQVTSMINGSSTLIMWISNNWKKLAELFHEEGLFRELQSAARCINFKIYDGRREMVGDPNSPILWIEKDKGPIAAAEALLDINGLKLYLQEYHLLSDHELNMLNYAIYRISPPLEDLFIFAFMFNLTTLFFVLDQKRRNYIKRKITLKRFLDIIRLEPSYEQLYLQYLDMARNNYRDVDKFLGKLTKTFKKKN